jgi:SH3 domain protein
MCLSATASAQNSPAASGDTRYIRDSLGVNLRASSSETSQVVAENLRSGTPLQLLQTDDSSGFSRVRAPGGKEGWLSSRYLQKEPTFEMKFKEAQARIAQLEGSAGSLQPRITQPQTDEGLRADNSRLARELEELKALSAKAVEIDRNNKALIRKNELLQTEVDKLSAENDRLSGQAAREEWTRTLIAIGLGILLTLALPRLVPRKKRYSDW